MEGSAPLSRGSTQEHPAPTRRSQHDAGVTTPNEQVSNSRLANIDPAGVAARRPPSGTRSAALSPASTSLSGSPSSRRGTRPLGHSNPAVPGALSLPISPAQAQSFDDTREYFSDNVFLFWKPPSIFSQWTPSIFDVLGVRYSCGEQFMMSEKAKLFGDIVTYDKIMATSDPAQHKSLGRQVRPFDYAEWERRREEIVLTGSYAKFAQNAAMKQHLLATGNRTLAEASPFDTLWGIGLPAHHPHAADPSKWSTSGKNLLGLALMRVRLLLRDRPLAGDASADSAFDSAFPEPPSSQPPSTSKRRIHEVASAGRPPAHEDQDTGSAGVRLDAPGDHAPGVHLVAPTFVCDDKPPLLEHGPDLVGGTLLIDSDSYTTRVWLHGGPTATSQLPRVALLDSGSPASFVTYSVVTAMIAAGALTPGSIRVSPSRRWGGFGLLSRPPNLFASPSTS